MSVKRKTLKEQREDAELELILEEFASAMRNAHRPYIADTRQFCAHAGPAHFTPNMERVWWKYVNFCKEHGEKA